MQLIVDIALKKKGNKELRLALDTIKSVEKLIL